MIGKHSQSRLKPVALGATVQSATYGQTIPVIYGRTKSALYLIWAANLRKSGGGKKYKKTFGKKSPPDYVQNMDFLIGHNPIAGALQFWANQSTRFPLNFAVYSASIPSSLFSPISITVPDANFYAVLGVTVDGTYNETFDDYGGTGSRTVSGNWEIPLWNAAYAAPDPGNGGTERFGVYIYYWQPGSGPTIRFPQADHLQSGPGSTAHIYYAAFDPTGGPFHDKSHGDYTEPAAALRLTFEPTLGDGPEFSGTDSISGAPLSDQQILYPHYAGLGSPDFDLGSTQTAPDVRAEILGSYPLYPSGDADFADMVEDLFKMGAAQAALGSAYAYTRVQHGLGCSDWPGAAQCITYSSLEDRNGPMSFYRPNTTGNMLIAVMRKGVLGNVISGDATDSAGNTYTRVLPTGGANQLWWAPSSSGSNAISFPAQDYDFDETILEIAGVDTFGGSAYNLNRTNRTVSLTTTNAPGTPTYLLVYANHEYATPPVPDQPRWTTIRSDKYYLAYRIVYAPGTYTFTQPEWPATSRPEESVVAMLAFQCSAPPAYPRALGNILDAETLDLCRLQCRANGLWGSMLLDSQQAASDWLATLYLAMNAAPVWSGFRLKSIPYSEVSAAGNGAIYNAPTASGPVADLGESDFLGQADAPLVVIERKAQVDVPNLLQIQHPNRASDYNDVTVSEPESGAIAMYGPRKASPKQLRCVQDVAVARLILGVAARAENYQRNTYKFKLTAKWKLLEPMDLVTITDSQIGLDALPVRLTSIAEDENYALDCEAEDFLYGVHAPTPVAITQAQPYQPAIGADPGSVNAPVIFEPIARLCQQTNQGEIWCVVSGSDPDYGGCQVYVSTDGGASYLNMGLTTGNAVTGITVGSWPSAADPDTANNLTVDLTESNGELISYQTNDEDNFVYPYYVAGGTSTIPYELMTYGVATLTATSTYRLEATGTGHKLRRSVFGAPTTGTGVLHASGSRFAFVGVQAPGVFKLPLDPKWIGQTLHLKFCAFNQYQGALQSLSDATDYTYVPTGIAQGSNPNAANYVVTPANPLSNPTPTSIAMAQVTVQFPSNTVRYNARTFTIPAPSTPTTYYVTVHDPGQLGDTGTATSLTAYCETTQAKLGQPGYTYIGSIVALPAGGGTSTTPGGWPINPITIGGYATGGGGTAVTETPAGTMNGTNKVFTLSNTPAAGTFVLYLNGVEQVPTTDYTISSATITFVVAPKSGDLMIAQYTH